MKFRAKGRLFAGDAVCLLPRPWWHKYLPKFFRPAQRIAAIEEFPRRGDRIGYVLKRSRDGSVILLDNGVHTVDPPVAVQVNETIVGKR